ncbi:MAG: cation transporter [Cellulosilyticaceae bacterium]
MKGLKKQLVKSFINLRVVSSVPGEIVIQSNAIAKIGEEFQGYDKQVENLALLLEGVQEVSVDYKTNKIKIKYDTSKLTPKKILKWVEIIIDVAIDYLEVIQQYGESNLDYVIGILREALIKRLKEVN